MVALSQYRVCLVLMAFVTCLSPAGAPQNTVEQIRFEPEEGVSIKKVFTMATDREGEDGPTTTKSTTNLELVVIDTYDVVVDGRVQRLERRFAEISKDSDLMRDGKPHNSSAGTSPELEGATVVFEWDDKEGEYRASSEDLDKIVLDGLNFDLDLTALLPDGEVVVGDEWSLDPEAFEHLTSPWKGLGLEKEALRLEKRSAGELTAKFTGLREIDEVQVAVIVIEGKTETESIGNREEATDNGSGIVHMEVEVLTISRVEGEAYWNLDGGHLHELQLEAEISSTGTVDVSFTSNNGEDFERTSELKDEGTWSFAVSFSAAE